ncbi:MAG: hypothetical protein K8T20_20060 [Planctomycetes bacterium]|nr:hypothetical protein [Planctomycetota bacterium]
MLASRWQPFGKGWLGGGSGMIYAIRFVNADGREHKALCRTGFLVGVWFTEDEIVEPAESR